MSDAGPAAGCRSQTGRSSRTVKDFLWWSAPQHESQHRSGTHPNGRTGWRGIGTSAEGFEAVRVAAASTGGAEMLDSDSPRIGYPDDWSSSTQTIRACRSATKRS